MNNKRFSERMGFSAPSDTLQLDTISTELRNLLWNLLRDGPLSLNSEYTVRKIKELIHNTLKQKYDDWPKMVVNQVADLETIFFDPKTTWYEIFDIVESLVVLHNKEYYFTRINEVLEQENSGYRFIGNQLMPITSQTEITSLEESLKITKSTGFDGANIHLVTALQHFGDRSNPDYRNAIKEAISSIESIVKVLGGSGEFSKVIKSLNEKLKLHPALIEEIIKLYGFTSDEEGIRHQILDQPNVGYDEAKYMMVVCSALLNFLISKAYHAGILNQ